MTGKGATPERRRHALRFLARVLAAVVVVPFGLGPAVVALADGFSATDVAATTTTIEAEPTTTQPAPTTQPVPTVTVPPTPVATSTSAPTTSAPTTVPTTATTLEPNVASGSGDTGAPTSQPAATVEVAPTAVPSDPTPTTDPSTGPVTSSPNDDTPSSSVDAAVDPDTATTPPPTTTGAAAADGPTGATTTTTTTPDVAATITTSTTTTTTTSTAVTSTTDPDERVDAKPVANAVGEPTAWTVALSAMQTYGYTPSWNLSIGGQSILGTDTFTLSPGAGPSTPVSRPDDFDAFVSVSGSGVGSFGRSWSCVGDDSVVPQTSTATSFVVSASVDDTVMDCVLSLTNPSPSTLVVRHQLDGMPLASADYTVEYDSVGGSPGAIGTLVDGDSVSLTTWQGIPLAITSSGVPGAELTDVVCSNSSSTDFLLENYHWRTSTGRAEIAGFRMVAGDTTDCTFVYSTLGTITIVEDVVPDGLGAPAAAYTITPADRVVSGPSSFDLTDGQTQTVVVADDQLVELRREPVPEFLVDGLSCVRLLDGGGTDPFPLNGSSWSPQGSATVNLRVSAGFDVECTFTTVPAGPPVLSIEQSQLVVDPSGFDDFRVEVTDGGSATIGIVDFAAEGTGGPVEVALPDRGAYTLTVLNPQGLEIRWNCGTTAGDSTTISVVRGDTPSCLIVGDENPAPGTATLELRKSSSPDPSRFYDIDVTLGAYPIESARLDDGGFPVSRFREGSPISFDSLGAGTYSVTESTPLTQLMTSVDCGGATVSSISSSFGDIDGIVYRRNTFSVAVVDGGAVTCDVVNESGDAPTILQVDVDVDPRGDTESYTVGVTPVSAVVSGPSSTVLTGSNSTTFVLANDTDVTVSQTPIDGYEGSSECGGPSTPGLTESFTTPILAGTVSCSFSNVGRPSTVTVRTETVPAGSSQAFDYTVSPSSALPSSFSQSHGDDQLVSVTADVDSAVIGQNAVSGFVTSSACHDPALDPFPTLVPGSTVTPDLRPGDELTCIFRNVETATGTVTMSVREEMTDPLDLTWDLDVSPAAAVSGPTGFSIANGGSDVAEIVVGAPVTVTAATDPRFTTTVECVGPSGSVVGAATIDVLVAADGDNVDCEFVFTPREATVTVDVVATPEISAPFRIDIRDLVPSSITLDAAAGSVIDADTVEIVDAPGSVTATSTMKLRGYETFTFDIDAPADYVIESFDCGTPDPVVPSRWTVDGGVPALGSLDCVVRASSTAAPPVEFFDVTVESDLDLGAVPIPERFPGIAVDFAGDLADDVIGQSERAANRSSFAGVGADQLVVPSNGSVAVTVVGGGDVTITPGAGSESFATTLVCPGGVGSAGGAVTLTAVSAPVTCTMTNRAANVTLRQMVSGPATATSWPYSITGVIAGPSAPTLSDGGSVTVAVAVESPVTMRQTDTGGATDVASSCGPIGSLRLAGGSLVPLGADGFRPWAPALVDDEETVVLSGGEAVTCTFVNTYPAVTPPLPPTGDPTPTPPPTPVPSPTTTTPVPTPTVTVTVGSTIPPTTPSGTPSTPGIPFAPVPPTPASTPPSSAPPTDDPVGGDPTTPTSTPETSSVPTTTPVSTTTVSTTPVTTVPSDVSQPPEAMITTEVPGDIFVDIGDPIPVDVECDGETVILVNGVEQDRVDRIEPSALGLGDHVIEVRCDDETITEVRAVVFEQDEGAPAGSNMTVIVMFVVMAVGAFLFAPSAASRKRAH